MIPPLMRRAAKFLALPAEDRALLFKAFSAVLAMRASLSILPFARARRVADTMSHPARIVSDAARPRAERVAWAVAAASRAVPGGRNCLVRALATGIVLKRYGYPSELKFGVAKPADGSFGAHAWLESGGVVVIGDFELDRYIPLDGRDSLGG